MGPQNVALTHETALSCSAFSVSYCEFMLPKNVMEIHRMGRVNVTIYSQAAVSLRTDTQMVVYFLFSAILLMSLWSAVQVKKIFLFIIEILSLT